MTNKPKIVLAYSGGLDTSVAIKWLQQQYGYDVVAVSLDVGEGKDLEQIRTKALQVGAIESYVVNAQQRFAEEFVLPVIQANAMYENKYPLVSALSRPLISQILVEFAEKTGAVAVAHGCTGKGNDQVRFELSFAALNPNLKIVAPVREWGWSRDEEIQFAEKHNIPVPVNKEKPYSIDANLWGRACECGVLEDPWAEPPEDAFGMTTPLTETPDTADEIELTFVKGKPVALNGVTQPLHELIKQLNTIAGKHGIGRIDHVENRLVGIKSREVYETPAAVVMMNAHKELECLTLPRELAHFKPVLEQKLSQIIYDGLWFSPVKDCVMSFIEQSQQTVSGTVRLKLFKGHAVVVGRKSDHSLYDYKLATYNADDEFDHQAALGFIQLHSLPTKLYAQVNKLNHNEE
ncbi:argininosuccinate synthase [Longirhabdus pacifica]|uniref:argininosuccinate synthase n=1 Tax=Longirhabdus pacifica TaxID=2305227 RepID=UPI001009321F|nr:argininosuccinate synthase [Longirhabdus pacifica]